VLTLACIASRPRKRLLFWIGCSAAARMGCGLPRACFIAAMTGDVFGGSSAWLRRFHVPLLGDEMRCCIITRRAAL